MYRTIRITIYIAILQLCLAFENIKVVGWW